MRIANSSRSYGDSAASASEMVERSPLDALTGDYPTELTIEPPAPLLPEGKR
jgi:hypothetical protein